MTLPLESEPWLTAFSYECGLWQQMELPDYIRAGPRYCCGSLRGDRDQEGRGIYVFGQKVDTFYRNFP